MSNEQPKYEMTLSLSVLEHLGVNLYSTVPAVVSETVANAWDADATEVTIEIRGEGAEKEIIVTDNGCGMSVDDINKKFLTVGYQRRKKDGPKTEGGRTPMGRKGIGKLSLFSIADHIEVYSKSKKHKEEAALLLDGEKIRARIKNEQQGSYNPDPIGFDADFPYSHGTRLVIKKLKRRVNLMTSKSLRKRLARRFGAGCTEKMGITVNDGGGKIKMSDREYFEKVKHLFQYGDTDYAGYCSGLQKINRRDCSFGEDGVAGPDGVYAIRGWIGLVEHTKDLAGGAGASASGRENLNKISVFAREKLGQDDILEGFGFNSYFARYIIGEIHADFLEDGEDDLATSSRQSYIEEASPYRALRDFMRKELRAIQDIWDNAKGEQGEEKALSLLPHPEFEEWLKSLNPRTREKAKRFFGKINRSLLETEEDEKRMFVYGVQAFESMRLKDALDTLETVSIENIAEFLQITRELDDLEASYYYNITRERLSVIRKLREHLEQDALESVLQEYVFNHLWLLDPSWDRATELPAMEYKVGHEFEKISQKLSDEEKRGRVDIKYRKTAGLHVIVELKRYSVSISQYQLAEQVGKYRSALEKCLENVADEDRAPEIVDIVCVLGSKPSNWKTMKQEDEGRRALREQRIRVVTYDKLIHDAERAYAAYLEKQKKWGKFLRIIDKALGENNE